MLHTKNNSKGKRRVRLLIQFQKIFYELLYKTIIFFCELVKKTKQFKHLYN